MLKIFFLKQQLDIDGLLNQLFNRHFLAEAGLSFLWELPCSTLPLFSGSQQIKIDSSDKVCWQAIIASISTLATCAFVTSTAYVAPTLWHLSDVNLICIFICVCASAQATCACVPHRRISTYYLYFYFSPFDCVSLRMHCHFEIDPNMACIMYYVAPLVISIVRFTDLL